jgi:hypothetical protein
MNLYICGTVRIIDIWNSYYPTVWIYLCSWEQFIALIVQYHWSKYCAHSSPDCITLHLLTTLTENITKMSRFSARHWGPLADCLNTATSPLVTTAESVRATSIFFAAEQFLKHSGKEGLRVPVEERGARRIGVATPLGSVPWFLTETLMLQPNLYYLSVIILLHQWNLRS